MHVRRIRQAFLFLGAVPGSPQLELPAALQAGRVLPGVRVLKYQGPPFIPTGWAFLPIFTYTIIFYSAIASTVCHDNTNTYQSQYL